MLVRCVLVRGGAMRGGGAVRGVVRAWCVVRVWWVVRGAVRGGWCVVHIECLGQRQRFNRVECRHADLFELHEVLGDSAVCVSVLFVFPLRMDRSIQLL